MKKLYALFIVFVLCACTPKTYVSKSYDFNKLNRIGILAFSSPGDAFKGAENLFAKSLIKYGYTVVERAQIEKVLAEHDLSVDSYLSPDITRKIGRVLGVEALLLGEITSYLPEQKKLAYNESRTSSTEPVFRNEVVKTPEGQTVIRTQYAGVQERRERNVQPHKFTIFAQVGVVAKMVDVNTAEIIWVGDHTTQAVSGLDAISSSANSLIRSFHREERKARKRK